MTKMRTKFNRLAWVMTALIGLGQAALAAKTAEPLTAQGEELLATYSATVEALRKEIVASVPKLDEAKRAAYLAAHGEIAKLPKLPNPNNLKIAPVTYCVGNPAYAEAQARALIAARAVLNEAEPFLGGREMHAD
ncbi:MAG: hypothetical protein HKO57_09705, partial [Akkermansiaceae bacterium]|nr:hypothetical protein [Akkermansiaceae bacterium]